MSLFDMPISMGKGADRGKREAQDDTQRSAKIRALGSEQLMQQITVCMAQLCLKNALDVRELQATTLTTVTIAADNALVTKFMGATKNYNDTMEKYKKVQCGPPIAQPHVHGWVAILELLMSDVPGVTVSAPHKEQITQHVNGFNKKLDLVSTQVHVARVKKTFKHDVKKFVFATAQESENIVKLIVHYLCEMGGQVKRGQAPKGGLERDLQEYLDRLKDLSGK